MDFHVVSHNSINYRPGLLCQHQHMPQITAWIQVSVWTTNTNKVSGSSTDTCMVFSGYTGHMGHRHCIRTTNTDMAPGGSMGHRCQHSLNQQYRPLAI